MKDIYLHLLNEGWTMNDIDKMDIFYYFDILEYKIRKDTEENKVYIDQVL